MANGTEMANLLFCTKKITGSLNTAAKFSASWKSPSEVPPSPTMARHTTSSPRRRAALAIPTACSIWVVRGVDWMETWCFWGS